MRVVIIGLGSIARKHIQAIQSMDPLTEMFALRTTTGDSVAGVTNLTEWNEITFVPDFFLISNPTSAHYSTIVKALEFKCPLFIEKPSVATLEEAEALRKKIRDLGIITYIGCDLRFHACLQWIRTYIQTEKPRINEVNIYCGSYLPDWRPGVDFRNSYSARPDLGGGVHLDLVHEIDYYYWLFGMPSLAHKSWSSNSSLEIPAVDYAHYIFKHPTFTANITLNYFRRDEKRQMEIITDSETIVVDLLASTVISSTRGVLFSSTETQSDKQMSDFVTRIQSKQESVNSFSESVDVLRLCLESTTI
jgi:predicted dehydrogenase